MKANSTLKDVAVAIFLSFLFPSCANNSSKQDQPNKNNESTNRSNLAEWTIMVFMNGDNNLESAAIKDFHEMSKVGSSNKINIVAQVDLIGKYYNVGWTQTLRFRIKQGMNPTPQNAVMDIGEADMGDPKVLKDFVSWSMKTYPAKKYALDIWDHGQGYRLYMTDSELLKGLNDHRFKRNIASNIEKSSEALSTLTHADNVHIAIGDPIRSSTQSPYRSCSNDESNDNDELFNIELRNGLLEALEGKKLDLLGFDACLMAMVETAYELRQVSRILVSSEDLTPNEGWDYNDWLKKLTDNPAIDGTSLSNILVESYKAASGSYSTNTLSSIDITNFDSVALTISKFSNELKKKLGTERANIIKARSQCLVFAPDHNNETPPKDYFFHIDFIRFCERIIELSSDHALKTSAISARDAIKATIINNYFGDLRSGDFGSNGLAIYFPISNTQYKQDVYERGGYKKNNTYYPVEFVQRQTWADFLHEYFKLVP